MQKLLLVLFSILFFVSCGEEVAGPNGFKLEQGTHYLFVANSGDNNISVIKIKDFKEIGKFGLGNAKYPYKISVDNGRLKYMAVSITGEDPNSENNKNNQLKNEYKILILKTETGEIYRELKLDKMPINAIFVNKELWVGQRDNEQSKILIYETENWTKIDSVIVGKGLGEINSYTKKNSDLIVTAPNSIDGTLNIIDVKSKSILKTIKVGDNPISAKSGENYISVTNKDSRSITVISKETFEIENTIDLIFTPENAIDQIIHSNNINNQIVWVTNNNRLDIEGGLYGYFKENNNWVTFTSKSTSKGTHSLDLLKVDASTGSYLFYTNQNENTVTSKYHNSRITEGSIEKTITIGKNPSGIAIFKPIGNPDPRFN